MDFPTLLEQCDPPEAVMRLSRELVARKAVTRELGSGPLPSPIRDFIDEEFAIARAHFPVHAHRISEDARRDATIFFRAMLRD